jgi:Rieske Fe-S protein
MSPDSGPPEGKAPSDPVRSPQSEPEKDRRGFLSGVSSVAMAGGLIGGYGVFAAMAGRFLYPRDSMLFRTPEGVPVNVARRGENGTVDDFIALSSTCPHLGCIVKWEPHNNRFFCPCHNGVFDPTGKGIEGPPGDAGQSLTPYPLRVEGGLLYMEVAASMIAEGRPKGDGPEFADGASRPGQDPCLFRAPAGRDPETRA